jgi:hypothetical protein
MSTTATKSQAAPSTTPAALADEPIDYRVRFKEILLAAAQGNPPDRKELNAVLHELGWDRRRWKKLLNLAAGRYQCEQKLKEQAAAKVEFEQLNSERETIAANCKLSHKLRAEELHRQLEAAYGECHAPLAKFDCENGQRLTEMQQLAHDNRYKTAMERTADPRIMEKISHYNHAGLSLSNQMQSHHEVLSKIKYAYNIEYSDGGTPKKLNDKTLIDRDWYAQRADSAKWVMDDPKATDYNRERAEKQYNAAAGEVEKIDEAKRMLAELSTGISAYHDRAEQLRPLFYQWQNFAIDFSDAVDDRSF